MATLKLDHVKTVNSRGHRYYYFNTGQKKNGKPIYHRLPDPSRADFYTVYASLKAGRTKRENAKALMTVSKLIDLYERSDDFKKLSRSTHSGYMLTFRKIRHNFGEAPADDLLPSDITLYMDQNAATPGAANMFKDVVGAIYKWGRRRSHTVGRPTADVAKLATQEHEPWPVELLESALKAENDRVRLAVHLLYYTGQRIGDVVRMRWSDIEGEYMIVRQQKTDKEMAVKLHKDLIAELARTPRKGFNIIGRWTGEPIGAQPIRIALKKFAGDYVPHGLRKNAVIALLEAGCSENEVGGITGQSPQMVRHYAKKISQRTLGTSAILKWETRK